jgi:site-specific recombinase XerD
VGEIIEERSLQPQQQQNEKEQYYHYQVTTGSLSKETKQTYTGMINWFLTYYRIKDIAPMHEYSPKVIKQMVRDYVVNLRDVKKLSRSSIRLHLCAIAHFFYMVRDDDYKIDWTKVKKELPPDENIR